MTKLEERLNEAADQDAKLLRPQDSPLEMNRRVFKAGARAVLELPELKAVFEATTSLRKEDTVGSDGTRIKCTCGREGCVDFYCSAGDRIYVSSYANRIHPEEAISRWRSFIGEVNNEQYK